MSIEGRLARLERANRRLKVGGLLGSLLVASVFAMGQARPPGRVETESVTILDRRGSRVGFFGVTYADGSDVGEPMLGFYDSDGAIGTYLTRCASYGKSRSEVGVP